MFIALFIFRVFVSLRLKLKCVELQTMIKIKLYSPNWWIKLLLLLLF